MRVKSDKSKTVLVVEDEMLVRKITRVRLEGDGYEVEVAQNGKEALKTAKKKKPDLILLDLLMPKMDGFEFLEKLKKEGVNGKMPVIVLTNLSQETDMERAKELGAKEFLIKADTSLDELCAHVEKHAV